MILFAPDVANPASSVPALAGSSSVPASMPTASEKTVAPAYLGVGRRGLIRNRDVPSRIIAFLRSAHPVKTAESVAALTGVSENTVKKWLTRSSVPSGLAILTLAQVYGPEFLAEVMPKSCGWLSAAAVQAKQDRLEAQAAQIARQLAELRT